MNSNRYALFPGSPSEPQPFPQGFSNCSQSVRPTSLVFVINRLQSPPAPSPSTVSPTSCRSPTTTSAPQDRTCPGQEMNHPLGFMSPLPPFVLLFQAQKKRWKQNRVQESLPSLSVYPKVMALASSTRQFCCSFSKYM